LSIPDILEHKRVFRGYPTEKPVPLLEVLITQSSQQNELVVDPFFGSGSTLLAALNLKRKYLGCDISSYAHDLFLERIKVGNHSV
ncbi:DNA methyltransferase, partial [Vibrio sp. 10N.261.45.F1]